MFSLLWVWVWVRLQLSMCQFLNVALPADRCNVQVILCIGEQLSEREAGKTKEVIYSQLDAVAKVVQVRIGVLFTPHSLSLSFYLELSLFFTIDACSPLLGLEQGRHCVRARLGHRHRQDRQPAAGTGGPRRHPPVAGQDPRR